MHLFGKFVFPFFVGKNIKMEFKIVKIFAGDDFKTFTP